MVPIYVNIRSTPILSWANSTGILTRIPCNIHRGQLSMYTAYTIRVWIGIMQCHMLPWVPPNGNIGSMKMEHKFSQNFTTNIKRREYVSYQTVLMEDNMMVKVDEKLTNKHANSNSWHVKPIQKLMNLIKILGFWINIVLQLLNTQSHHRDHIVMSHFNHLDHLCKTHLITTILDLRKWSDIMEGLQIPVSNLDWEKNIMEHSIYNLRFCIKFTA